MRASEAARAGASAARARTPTLTACRRGTAGGARSGRVRARTGGGAAASRTRASMCIMCNLRLNCRTRVHACRDVRGNTGRLAVAPRRAGDGGHRWRARACRWRLVSAASLPRARPGAVRCAHKAPACHVAPACSHSVLCAGCPAVVCVRAGAPVEWMLCSPAPLHLSSPPCLRASFNLCAAPKRGAARVGTRNSPRCALQGNPSLLVLVSPPVTVCPPLYDVCADACCAMCVCTNVNSSTRYTCIFTAPCVERRNGQAHS